MRVSGTNGRMKVATIGGLLAALSLAACGGGGDSSTGNGDQAKIVLLADKSGENPLANDHYVNGTTFAVEDINAEGGVNGEDLAFERFTSSPSEPQAAIQSVQKAGDADPTVIIGMQSINMIRASLSSIADTGVPFIHQTSGNLTAEDLEEGGGKLFQAVGSTMDGPPIEIVADYAVNDLGAERIGILYVDLELGLRGKETIERKAEELGVEVVAARSYAIDDTDLTSQVLAMKDADVDAVVNWGYPEQMTIQLEQFEQNGMEDIPTFGTLSAGIIAEDDLIKPELLDNLFGFAPCNPAVDDEEWSARYEERFDALPQAIDALTYDLTRLAAVAIEEAESTDPEAVTAAIDDVNYMDGICAPEYGGGGDLNVLTTHSTIVQYDRDSKVPTTVYSNE